MGVIRIRKTSITSLSNFVTSSIIIIFSGLTLLSSSATAQYDATPTPLPDPEQITVLQENWRYLSYREQPLCLTTTGSTCNNLPLLFGDMDPKGIRERIGDGDRHDTANDRDS